MKRYLLYSLLFLLLAACTPAAEPSAPEAVLQVATAVSNATIPPPVVTVDTPRINPTTAVVLATQPAIEPTAEPLVAEVANVGVVYGRTEEGAFFQGDPDAPIVHLDYSDFL